MICYPSGQLQAGDFTATVKKDFSVPFRFAPAIAILAASALSAMMLGAPEMAYAQGKVEARYTAWLSGIPLGKGAWIIDISEDQYSAAASGKTSGLLRVFAPGEGSGGATGIFVSNQFVPSSYAASITTGKKTEDIRMTLSAGNVEDFAITPTPPPLPDRIPLTEAHRRGVVDPMTASLARVAGNGDILSPEACQRRLSVFDGRLRYDLAFAFKRVEMVKAAKGYAGPAIVCAVYFSPVAGHIPDRAAIKYLVKQRDMEVWLVPIAGTRVLVPFRASVPTPLGLGVLEATQFVSVPQPTKASAKTQ
jgi:hypothetical protein